MKPHRIGIGLLAMLTLPAAAFARIASADVARSGPGSLELRWQDANAVDIYEADSPGFTPAAGRLIARANHDGRYNVDHAGLGRHYFALVDTHDHDRVTVAERVLPLAQGSNFRDVGGYAGAGGKHVRWGLIYRSAAQPLLTDGDLGQVKALGLGRMVDLRSSEERAIAPSRIEGVPYEAVGYSMTRVFGSSASTQMHNGADIYRNFPTLLAPQLRLIFDHLLHRSTPILYNCSAGADRTGFVTAIILTVLGVPRETIVVDYELTPRLRRPEFEIPKLDPASYPEGSVGRMLALGQQRPEWKLPRPLDDAQGPFLRGAFEAIDAQWGSVDAYLDKAVGVSAADVATLRRIYLE